MAPSVILQRRQGKLLTRDNRRFSQVDRPGLYSARYGRVPGELDQIHVHSIEEDHGKVVVGSDDRDFT